MSYDKNRLVNNIEFLVKKNNLRIGEIETYCGVSIGYFSRLKNNDNMLTSPSLETIFLLSEQLKVSVTSLVLSDFSKLTETEIFLQSFLENIISKTEQSFLDWDKLTLDELSNLSYGPDWSNPLIDYEESGFTGFIFYHSLFLKERRSILNNCYIYQNKDRSFLFVPLGKNSHITGFELYLITQNGNVNKICNSNEESLPIFAKLMNDLYQSILTSSTRIKIANEVKNNLELFMKEDINNEK